MDINHVHRIFFGIGIHTFVADIRDCNWKFCLQFWRNWKCSTTHQNLCQNSWQGYGVPLCCRVAVDQEIESSSASLTYCCCCCWQDSVLEADWACGDEVMWIHNKAFGHTEVAKPSIYCHQNSSGELKTCRDRSQGQKECWDWTLWLHLLMSISFNLYQWRTEFLLYLFYKTLF